MKQFAFLLAVFLAAPACFGAFPTQLWKKDFSAADFAETINYFVELGEEKTSQEMQALEERYGSSLQVTLRLGWVCRVLYDAPAGMPIRTPAVGAYSLPYKTMPPQKWPRFPVVQSGKTYFVLDNDVTLGGTPVSIGGFLRRSQMHGIFRTTKVTVPTQEQAQRDAEALHQSQIWSEAWPETKPSDRAANVNVSQWENGVREVVRYQAENIR